MNRKIQSYILVCLTAAVIGSLSLWSILRKPDDYSDSERRLLAKAPEFSADTVLSGSFMSDFEVYGADQFPMRDKFRTLKSFSVLKLFGQSDNNKLFAAQGHISKIEYPMSETMLDHAANRFGFIYDSYLKDKDIDVYLSVIPDKNFCMSDSDTLRLDYQLLIDKFKERTDYTSYIDITDLVSLDDFYNTDTHWKQENIIDIASALTQAMNSGTVTEDYTLNTLDNPFYGVYYGQLALPFKPDTITYLTNDIIDSFIVTSYDTGAPVSRPVYNMEKAKGKDPYEMFLSGSDALLTIENPNSDSDRELIVFRDSFGSSIAPLIAQNYAKVTLVDIRYVQSGMLGNLIDFHDDQDVLFLYSTLLINNSLAMK